MNDITRRDIIELMADPTTLGEIRPESLKAESPAFILTILMYEVGEIAKSYVYADNYDLSTDLAYRAFAKTGVADAITMLRFLCEMWGIDFWEMIILGQAKYEDKMNGIKDGKRPDSCG